MSPLIVIVGPTASGKTAAAIELAKLFNGEIICADSRTVYKHMDIGTAKPTASERAEVPHHLLDVALPDERFTVADFKRLANQAIDDISKRGTLPIMVGGSGLYIDSVLYDYSFAEVGSRRDMVNPRHAAKDLPKKRATMRGNTLIIGMSKPRDELRSIIEARVETMVQNGLVQEVTRLTHEYPHSSALEAPGYKAFKKYIDHEVELSQAKALFVTADYQLAKRQVTWFKRNDSIHWTNNREEIVDLVTTHLNKKT